MATLTTPRRHKSYQTKFTRGHLPEDLKDVQGAIGCLYGELPDADEYGAFRMPKKHIDMYHQLGYVTMPHAVLSPTQVDCLVDEVHQLCDDREHHPKTEYLYATSLTDINVKQPVFHCQGQWRAAWAMHDLVMMPHLTVPCSQLLGDSLVRLWYDEVLMKAPRVGPCIPWQQNYSRWQHTKPINHVTVAVALDTLTKDKSAPCLIPGSHRWRDGELLEVPPYDGYKDEASHMNAIWDIVNDEERECLMDSPPVTVELQRGQVMFLHPSLMYSTHANRTLDHSKLLYIHYMGDNTFTVQQGALLPKTTRFPPDVKVQGPFYPAVFDPSMMEEADDAPQIASE
jgi:hypothetical protein